MLVLLRQPACGRFAHHGSRWMCDAKFASNVHTSPSRMSVLSRIAAAITVSLDRAGPRRRTPAHERQAVEALANGATLKASGTQSGTGRTGELAAAGVSAAKGLMLNGAEAGTRTPTPLRALDPE